MRNLSTVLILLLLISSLAYSQDMKKEGSDRKADYSSSPSKSKLRLSSSSPSLLQKAEQLGAKEPKAALDYVEEALSISLRDGDKIGEANAYVTLGNINTAQQLNAQAITAYDKALTIFTQEKVKARLAPTRKLLGQAYENNGDYAKALEHYQLALKQAQGAKQETEVVSLKSRIANVYKLQGKTEDALIMYQEVLTEEKEQKNTAGEIDANNNIGDIYVQQKKIGQAKTYYESSQDIAIKDNNAEKLDKSYENIINTYKLEGNATDELQLRLKKAAINEQRKEDRALVEDYLEIGRLYANKQKSKEAFLYLHKSKILSANKGYLDFEAQAYEEISKLHKQQKNYAQALENYELYIKTKDSLLHSNQKQLSLKLSVNDELAVKQKQIDLLEKDMQLNEKTILLLEEEKRFSQLVIYALLVVLLLVVLSAWLIYSNAKKRRIANQALILRSLRSQMNPHFIFNALNSVNNFISKNDERSANKYLSDFSKLMRTVMENSRHEFISLATELSILQLYLSLEHARFKEKFDYELIVSPDITAELMHIPPMLVQPYIENAIWHGLRYKEEKGRLNVTIVPINNELLVTITDDGIGRTKSLELKTHNQKDKDSIGLKNTEARIKIINELYKTNMRVIIEDLHSDTHSGTKVSLYITQTTILQHEA